MTKAREELKDLTAEELIEETRVAVEAVNEARTYERLLRQEYDRRVRNNNEDE